MNFTVNKQLLEKLNKAKQVAEIAKSDNPVEALTNVVTSQANDAKEKDEKC